MRKQLLTILLPLLFLGFSAVSKHKYHMALYQIEFAAEKKMLQITTRIHIDDLNKAFEKKYKKKLSFTNEASSSEAILINDYFNERFLIEINNQPKIMNLRTKEVDGDELVCYWAIKNISKIKEIKLTNTVLIDFFHDQHNLVNLAIFGKKQSCLFTQSLTSKEFKF